MSSPDDLMIETPAGIVRASAGPRRTDGVVFELHGAMRGSVHVTGTHHPYYWDQFTAVRACLGPLDAYESTAPDDALPRLAHGRSGYRGSLTRYPQQHSERLEESVHPLSTAAGNELSPKTYETLTAVLRACADAVARRDDLPQILKSSRLRKTPKLLRFLSWATAEADATAVRCAAEAQAASRELTHSTALWWAIARMVTTHPHPVLLLMLADREDSLARHIQVMAWKAPYYFERATEERARAVRFRGEAASLRTQGHSRAAGGERSRRCGAVPVKELEPIYGIMKHVELSAGRTGRHPMASFDHVTPQRCVQLGRALTAAGLPWHDNGHQEDPQYLTVTTTDPHGRIWRISPATNFQITPSSPGKIWQASCDQPTATTGVLSARAVAQHIKGAGP
ncbi:hypothetical protein [Streptomyces sp. NBC_00648]|uniref:hypothetical protein n=1 Tax=Streptomyces sp. NBC_00648 TaxID=2975797 RepID=UPI003245984D